MYWLKSVADRTSTALQEYVEYVEDELVVFVATFVVTFVVLLLIMYPRGASEEILFIHYMYCGIGVVGSIYNVNL